MAALLAPRLWAVALAVLALNVPFGFWRAGTRKFSLPWFLAIHLPVPAVVALRILLKLGWTVPVVGVLMAFFFLGQFVGSRLRLSRSYRSRT